MEAQPELTLWVSPSHLGGEGGGQEGNFNDSWPSSFVSCRRSEAIMTCYLLAQLLHLLQEPKVIPPQTLEVVHFSSGQDKVVVTSLGKKLEDLQLNKLHAHAAGSDPSQ